MDKILGYTLKQWAIVFAAFPCQLSSISDAVDARAKWLKYRSYEPGSEIISTPHCDFDSSSRLLEMVLRTRYA